LAELLDPFEQDHLHGCLLPEQVWQQRHVAGALDRVRQHALLLVRYRRDARRHDLAALRNEALEQLHIFVVDARGVRAREGTGLLAAEEGPALSAVAAATLAAFTLLAH